MWKRQLEYRTSTSDPPEMAEDSNANLGWLEPLRPEVLTFALMAAMTLASPRHPVRVLPPGYPQLDRSPAVGLAAGWPSTQRLVLQPHFGLGRLPASYR
jgi:hypothetical protein